MTESDWTVIQAYIAILEPIRVSTDIMQGWQKKGKKLLVPPLAITNLLGKYGSTAKVLVLIKWLLEHLKHIKYYFTNNNTLSLNNKVSKMLVNNIN